MNSNSDFRQADDLKLKEIIRYLCVTKIRYPMNFEQVKTWLKQFNEGPNKTLALLILRYLIYRTSDQFESSLKQALKSAAVHFTPSGVIKENTDWRDVLNGKVMDLSFSYGPPKHQFSPPGKSGEIISRLLKRSNILEKFSLVYPDMITTLDPKERYLLIDDGAFTGQQLAEFIRDSASFLHSSEKAGIVVGLVHQKAIEKIGQDYPTLPIFYGEKITSQECFVSMCNQWVKDETWVYSDINPLDLYMEIVEKAKFSKKMPLGFGGLGCLIAYEHGVPDDSLQLLWDNSEHWQPLFTR